MRLAQIARKLDINPSVIIKYIEQTFEAKIAAAPNTKIPDEYVNNILEHFTPEMVKNEVIKTADSIANNSHSEIKEEVNEKEEEEEEEVVPDIPVKAKVTPITKEIEGIEKDTVKEETHEEINELNIEDGVIKAPKVEVRGIKIIDKIELPTTHKKEAEVEEDNEKIENSDEETKPEIQPKPKVKKKQKPRDTHAIDYQEKIKKDQIDYEKEVKKRKEKEKQKKKARYEQMIRDRKKAEKISASKNPASTVKQRKNQEQTQGSSPAQKEPKTRWQKFIKWLNT